MADKIFVDGVFAKKKEKSPAFIITSISVKVADFIPFLEKHRNNAGYVNFDVLLSQKGTQYCQLDTWQPTKDKASEEVKNQSKLNEIDIIDYPEEKINADDIPF